jgi:hypothetical protein
MQRANGSENSLNNVIKTQVRYPGGDWDQTRGRHTRHDRRDPSGTRLPGSRGRFFPSLRRLRRRHSPDRSQTPTQKRPRWRRPRLGEDRVKSVEARGIRLTTISTRTTAEAVKDEPNNKFCQDGSELRSARMPIRIQGQKNPNLNSITTHFESNAPHFLVQGLITLACWLAFLMSDKLLDKLAVYRCTILCAISRTICMQAR